MFKFLLSKLKNKINPPIPTYVVEDFNWIGRVPLDLTWEKAWPYYNNIIRPMKKMILPLFCPKCQLKLQDKEYDWEAGIQQYMVWTKECPNGHGAFIECA